MTEHFALAALGRRERLITATTCITLAAATFAIWIAGLKTSTVLTFGGICFAIVAGSFSFAPRSVRIQPGRLIVHRLLGTVSHALPSGPQNPQLVNPLAGATRIMGVGGLFGYFGRFRSAEHNTIFAYVTDSDKAVTLTTTEGTVVVSPEDAQGLIDRITKGA